MATRKSAVRAASVALLMGGAGMFFLQSGLIPGIGNAQPTIQGPAGPITLAAAPEAPSAPAVFDAPQVALPAQALRPIPVSLQEPAALPQAAPAELALEALPTPGDTTEPEEVALSPFGLPCDLSVTTSAMPAAMVALDIMAPCQAEARIVIEHSGLTLTGQTDALGLLTLDVPAFESPAFFTVRLPDGSAENSLVTVPDLADYDRVAVQWVDDRQLALHAIPAGTGFGEPGHIWQEAPGDQADAMTGTGGFLTQIGDLNVDDPQVAQIFTFPHASLSDGDVIELSIDAPVTETTCGQPVVARTLEMTRAGPVEVTPLTLTLPGCDAVGDYLVLQNLLQDLTVASN